MNDSAHSAKNFDPEANRKYEPETDTVSKATVHAVGQGMPHGFARPDTHFNDA